MSIIAYRDGIIACDGRMTSGNAITSDNVRKIAKGPGVVGGFVGGAEELTEYLKWVESGADFAQIPNGVGTGFIVFDRSVGKRQKVELFCVDKTKYLPVPLKPDYYADGSGFKAAMGAFYMGANAVEAVKASISCINDTGGLIQQENLFDD